jgi:hypothetical protein
VGKFISTYRLGDLLESGRSERHPHSFFIPPAKTLRSLPKGHAHVQAPDDPFSAGFHCLSSPVVALGVLDLRIDKTYLAFAAFHRSFPKFTLFISGRQ